MARAGDGTMTNTAPAHPSTIPTPAHPTTPSLPQATPKPYISHPPPSSPAHHSKEPARVPSTKTALGVTGKLTMPPQCMQREQRSPCSSVSHRPCMSGQMGATWGPPCPRMHASRTIPCIVACSSLAQATSLPHYPKLHARPDGKRQFSGAAEQSPFQNIPETLDPHAWGSCRGCFPF